MIDLSDGAIRTINSALQFIKQDISSLDDIEYLTDILEGEIEENNPGEEVSRSEIRHYLISIL